MALHKYHAEQVAFAESLGMTDVRIIKDGRVHAELTGIVNGKTVSESLGTSKPGDWRSPLNFRRDLRYAIARARGDDIPYRHQRHMASRGEVV